VNTNRMTARIVGILFLFATVTYMIGSGLLDSVLNAPDYLMNLYPNKTQVITGVLLEFIDAAAVVGIGLLLYPILKKHNKTIALGYAGVRIVEAVILIFGAIRTLSLITLSREFIQAGAPEGSNFQALGASTIAESYLAYQMAMIVLGLGSLMFCYLLYKTILVPRLISILGIIGYAALFTGMLLEIFGFNLGLVLLIPSGLFELILPIWLIVKGFNSPAIPSGSENPL